MINYPGDAELLRTEIAIAAARMIAEEGTDYGSAKRKAAKLILGNSKVRGDILPDNAQIESEVRQYQALFMGEEQIQRLLKLRLLALDLMEKFADFQPCLTGAVANGTAGEHSDIYMQLFSESSKDVAVFLLNAGIDYVVTETPHFRHPDRMVETLSFIWKHEGVHLILYELDDQRGGSKNAAGRSIDRLSLTALRALIAESNTK
jgi:hypothetical protein